MGYGTVACGQRNGVALNVVVVLYLSSLCYLGRSYHILVTGVIVKFGKLVGKNIPPNTVNFGENIWFGISPPL